MAERLSITARVLPDGRSFIVNGRVAWALSELVRAGARGVTPIDMPGPRWAAYVHSLRHERGVDVETLHEEHDGPFPGRHARYVLRSIIEIMARSDDAGSAAA